jgi:hypothetical protein
MSRFVERPARPWLAAALGIAAILGGCSDIYYDRRETVLFGADNAVAANAAVQTIEPWPRASAVRTAPANGERVAAAIARYRTGRVYVPLGNDTMSASQLQQQQAQQQGQESTQSSQGGGGASSGASGIPVK